MASLLAFEFTTDLEQELFKFSPADPSGFIHTGELCKYRHPYAHRLLRYNWRVPLRGTLLPPEFGEDSINRIILDEVSEKHPNEFVEALLGLCFVPAGRGDVKRGSVRDDLIAFFDERNGQIHFDLWHMAKYSIWRYLVAFPTSLPRAKMSSVGRPHYPLAHHHMYPNLNLNLARFTDTLHQMQIRQEISARMRELGWGIQDLKDDLNDFERSVQAIVFGEPSKPTCI